MDGTSGVEDGDTTWKIVVVILIVILLLGTSLVCLCMSWRAILNNEQWCICNICCLLVHACRRRDVENGEQYEEVFRHRDQSAVVVTERNLLDEREIYVS